MWLPRVEQLFHPIFHVFRHTPEQGMVDPVLCSILSQRVFLQAVSGDAIIQVQQNSQTTLCDEGMSLWHRDIILTGYHVGCFGKAG
jgi:hypothetical protein